MSTTFNDDLRRQEIENCIETFSMFGNDSSNEEEDGVRDKLENLLQNKRQLEYKYENGNTEKYLNAIGHNNLSFINHAVAIKFLHSSKIHSAYIAKKKKIGPMYKVNFNYKQLKKGIRKSAKHIVQWNRRWNQYAVEKDISKKIFGDPDGFFKSLMSNTRKTFFKELIDKGYDEVDLLSRQLGELGQLKMEFKGRSEETLSVDLSDPKKYEQFSVEFFSNLRQHSKLEESRMRSGSKGVQTSSWKYSNSASVTIKHEIKIKVEVVYKGEEVLFADKRPSYPEIYAALKLTSEDARKLLVTFKTGPGQLTESLASLHYLLFGLEVMRNPSALIHNMMMLELIQNEKFSWEDAFEDCLMPMSMSLAERASRIKNSLYSQYMPRPYVFDVTYLEYSKCLTPEEKDKAHRAAFELLKKEQEITRQWLEMEYTREYGELKCKVLFNEQGDIKMKYVDLVHDYIKKACKKWYDIDI